MNIVQQMYDAITTVAQATLGVDWRKMKRVFDPGLNTDRHAEKSFGVVHGAAVNADGVLRNYTLDHSFELILQRTVVDKGDDVTDVQSVINDLYDKADDCFVQFLLQKLGLPAIVLIVNEPSISAPEILPNKTVVLRLQFNVKYRNAVSL